MSSVLRQPNFQRKALNKGFKITADIPGCGSVTFGLLRNRVWITVVRLDGDSICSLDNPITACRLAAAWLEKDFWPAFAVQLHPDNSVSDAQTRLF